MSDAAKETREINNVMKVVFKSVGNLYISQGETEQLIIEAHPDTLPNIQTTVENGVLTIRYKFDWNDILGMRMIDDPIHYYLTVRDLQGMVLEGAGKVESGSIKTSNLELILSGAGSLEIGSLEAQNLKVNLSGAGSINATVQLQELTAILSGAGSFDMHGTVVKQSVILSGTGSYNAQNATSQEAQITLSGLGSAHMNVSGILHATISGIGSVEYTGNPQIQSQITGLGSLKAI
jgi:hypothetical protein